MSIWAIADLHLCFSTPNKSMEIFGENWKNYSDKIKINWEKNIKADDLILIAGDISWAMNINDALIDLKWIDNLPGKKLLIKGNHDFWWPSKSKLKSLLPPSISFLQNDAFTFHNASIGGSRLWDTSEYSFDNFTLAHTDDGKKEMDKIYDRELLRLENSLKLMEDRPVKICMTHFPPIGPDLKPSKASKLLEKYKINTAIFGHLHNIPSKTKLFGMNNNINYQLISADFLNFSPLLMLS
jgi:predicted phosphohydrolase